MPNPLCLINVHKNHISNISHLLQDKNKRQRRSVSILFLRFCAGEVVAVLPAPLSSSSLGSVFISGFFSSVSIGSCFGSAPSGSSFFTIGDLVSSSCYVGTTMVNQLYQSREKTANTEIHFKGSIKWSNRTVKNAGQLNLLIQKE